MCRGWKKGCGTQINTTKSWIEQRKLETPGRDTVTSECTEVWRLHIASLLSDPSSPVRTASITMSALKDPIVPWVAEWQRAINQSAVGLQVFACRAPRSLAPTTLTPAALFTFSLVSVQNARKLIIFCVHYVAVWLTYQKPLTCICEAPSLNLDWTTGYPDIASSRFSWITTASFRVLTPTPCVWLCETVPLLPQHACDYVKLCPYSHTMRVIMWNCVLTPAPCVWLCETVSLLPHHACDYVKLCKLCSRKYRYEEPSPTIA
jgi:hypothetical protein